MLLLSLETVKRLADLGSISASICCRDEPEQEQKTCSGNGNKNTHGHGDYWQKTTACSVIRFSETHSGLFGVVYKLA